MVWCGVMHSNYDRGGKFTGGTTPDPMSEYLECRWDGGIGSDREREIERDYDWTRTPKMTSVTV